jgi:hypothetical protein
MRIVPRCETRVVMCGGFAGGLGDSRPLACIRDQDPPRLIPGEGWFFTDMHLSKRARDLFLQS